MDVNQSEIVGKCPVTIIIDSSNESDEETHGIQQLTSESSIYQAPIDTNELNILASTQHPVESEGNLETKTISDEDSSVNSLDVSKFIDVIVEAIGIKRIKEIDEELAKLPNPVVADITSELENENFELKLLLNLVKKAFGYSSIQEMLYEIFEKEKNGFEVLSQSLDDETNSTESQRNLYKSFERESERDAGKRPGSSIDVEIAKCSKKKITPSYATEDSGIFDFSADDGESCGNRIDVKSKKFDDYQYYSQGSTFCLKRHNKPAQTFTSDSIPPKDEVKNLLSILSEFEEIPVSQGVKVKCPEPGCDRVLSSKAYARERFLVKHLGITFKCPVENCPKSFKNQSALSNHLKTHKSKLTRVQNKKC